MAEEVSVAHSKKEMMTIQDNLMILKKDYQGQVDAETRVERQVHKQLEKVADLAGVMKDLGTVGQLSELNQGLSQSRMQYCQYLTEEYEIQRRKLNQKLNQAEEDLMIIRRQQRE